MLRAFVLVLVVANLGFYAWTHGWLDAVVGVSAHGGREPERLSRQVRPEAIRILPPSAIDAPASPPAPPAAPLAPVGALSRVDAACLQAGPLAPSDAVMAESQVRAALPGLAPAALANLQFETPGVWLVYLGRFANREALQKKADELRRVPRLVFEEVHDLPQLEPGLVLGRHDNRAAAENALTRLADRGVRNARVLALTPPSTWHTLRVERADEALKAQLQGLTVGPAGSAFVACPSATAVADGAR